MINKVILVGNVGNDPEVRHIDNDTSVANFSIATTESYTNKSGEKVSNTEWHRIVAWRGLAKVVENYIKKGAQLYVEGKLQTRNWDDKDGNKRYVTEINADTIKMLGRRQDSESSQTVTQTAEAPDFPDNGNDDLPF